jgi:hypothetical protein
MLAVVSRCVNQFDSPERAGTVAAINSLRGGWNAGS